MAGQSQFTPELANTICDAITNGESLRSLRRSGAIPVAPSTICLWLSEYPSFAEQYARAREASADSDADHVADIAMRVLSGEVDPNAGRVAIDALKWSAGKRKPKIYGDRIDVQIDQSISISNALSLAMGRVIEGQLAYNDVASVPVLTRREIDRLQADRLAAEPGGGGQAQGDV